MQPSILRHHDNIAVLPNPSFKHMFHSTQNALNIHRLEAIIYASWSALTQRSVHTNLPYHGRYGIICLRWQIWLVYGFNLWDVKEWVTVQIKLLKAVYQQSTVSISTMSCHLTWMYLACDCHACTMHLQVGPGRLC